MKIELPRRFATTLLAIMAAFGAGAAPQPLTNTPATLHNVFRLTPRVLSGSQPEGDADFAWLAAQGIKTIVSVDGSRPDVDTARRHGLRYAHLPIGYDGISANRLAELGKAAATLPGPIFVHCHHGKHRGPAAAAVICEATEKWTATEAEAFLKQAGTSADYPGLYQSVRSFRAPDSASLVALTNALPEVALMPGLVQAMVAVDGQMERLRACQKAGWRTPPDHPDVSPAHEAIQLWELFRELGRAKEMKEKSAAFIEILTASEKAADELRRHLQDSSSAASARNASADVAFRRVAEQCVVCHKRFRN